MEPRTGIFCGLIIRKTEVITNLYNLLKGQWLFIALTMKTMQWNTVSNVRWECHWQYFFAATLSLYNGRPACHTISPSCSCRNVCCCSNEIKQKQAFHFQWMTSTHVECIFVIQVTGKAKVEMCRRLERLGWISVIQVQFGPMMTVRLYQFFCAALWLDCGLYAARSLPYSVASVAEINISWW